MHEKITYWQLWWHNKLTPLFRRWEGLELCAMRDLWILRLGIKTEFANPAWSTLHCPILEATYEDYEHDHMNGLCRGAEPSPCVLIAYPLYETVIAEKYVQPYSYYVPIISKLETVLDLFWTIFKNVFFYSFSESLHALESIVVAVVAMSEHALQVTLRLDIRIHYCSAMWCLAWEGRGQNEVYYFLLLLY